MIDAGLASALRQTPVVVLFLFRKVVPAFLRSAKSRNKRQVFDAK